MENDVPEPPTNENGEILFQYKCESCENEEEYTDKKLLGTCSECGERLHHVGPVLDICDDCGDKLLYNGNSGLGDDTLCDTCYDRADAMGGF